MVLVFTNVYNKIIYCNSFAIATYKSRLTIYSSFYMSLMVIRAHVMRKIKETISCAPFSHIKLYKNLEKNVSNNI